MTPTSTVKDGAGEPLLELLDRVAHLESAAGRARVRTAGAVVLSVLLLSGLAVFVAARTQQLGGFTTQLVVPPGGTEILAPSEGHSDREESLFSRHPIEIGVGLLGGLIAIAITVYLFTRPA